MSTHREPRVGVGVIVLRDGQVLLGERLGSHGAGTWALPGGHLEFGESVADCARREVLEETGLVVTSVAPGPYTNDVMPGEDKHYVTLFVQAAVEPGAPRVMEPGKCAGWQWYPWTALPQPLFQPMRTLVQSGFMPADPLERFVRAQARDYAQALAELTAGRKRTHWIWYGLPQLRELGRSRMAREYGIAGGDEALAYLAHPVLGPRLRECVAAILGHADRSAGEMLGEVDAMKFRSCLTLFAAVAPGEACFSAALAAFYDAQPDVETLRLLGLPAA